MSTEFYASRELSSGFGGFPENQRLWHCFQQLEDLFLWLSTCDLDGSGQIKGRVTFGSGIETVIWAVHIIGKPNDSKLFYLFTD